MQLGIGTTGSPRENTAAWLAQIMLPKESAANRLPGQRSYPSSERRNSDARRDSLIRSYPSSERRNSDARLWRDTQRSHNQPKVPRARV